MGANCSRVQPADVRAQRIFGEASSTPLPRAVQRVLEHPLLGLIARLVVGGIFVMYAVDKIAAPADFALNIERYQLLPLPVVNLVAIVLPWVELVVGLFLIAGIRVRAVAAIAAVLLIVFLIAIGSAMARGLQINCGCSAHAETVGWGKLIEDAVYLLLALRLVWNPASVWALETVEAPALARS